MADKHPEITESLNLMPTVSTYIDHGTNDTTNFARLRVPNPERHIPNRKERRKMAAVQRRMNKLYGRMERSMRWQK